MRVGFGSFTALLVATGLVACAPRQHGGMVVDPETGLQYGAVIERSLVVEPSQFADRRLKLRLRNSSGDAVFDLGGFRQSLEGAYHAKGYAPGANDDFGVLLDVNVVYSGQTSESLAVQYGFLGAAAGGVGGYHSGIDASAATGTVTGTALGAILGSYVTDDTYIVIAEVTLAVPDERGGRTERVIQFGVDDAAESRSEDTGRRRFDETLNTRIAVFAGGRNAAQAEIAAEVRRRFERILADVI